MTQEHLEGVRKKDREITRQTELISALRALLIGTSRRIEDVKVQTSFGCTHSKIEEVEAEIAEEEDKLDQMIDAFVEYKQSVIRDICGLAEPEQREVLLKIYIEYKPRKIIAEEMDKSPRSITDIHHAGLRQLCGDA